MKKRVKLTDSTAQAKLVLVRTRKARSRKRTLLILTSTILAVLLIGGGATALYLHGLTGLVQHGDDHGNPNVKEADLIEPVDIVDKPDDTTEIVKTATEKELIDQDFPIRSSPDVYNLLLIGSDNRGDEINGRSDAMIILSINKKSQKIHLVSLQRQLYVEIAGHEPSMLNFAYSFGGSKLLLQTIESNFRIKIDDYVAINFAGFTKAIDIVGGIEIPLTEKEAAELNTNNGTSLSAGMTLLDGKLALAYSRIRHIDSDYKRTGRQRLVIQTLIGKMSKLDPIKLDQVARQILPLVRTNLSESRLVGLSIDAMKYKDYPISQLMIPLDGTHKTIIVRKMEVRQFDYRANIKALLDFLYSD